MADIKKRVERGSKAAALLGDETLLAAFDALEALYTSDWKNSKVDEVEKRAQAYSSLRSLDDLKTQLRVFVDNGKIAAKQLQRDRDAF